MPSELPNIIEALLIASEEPLSVVGIQRVLKQEASRQLSEEELSDTDAQRFRELAITKTEHVLHTIEGLNELYKSQKRSFQILNKSNGWKIYTNPEHADFVAQLFPQQRSNKLSKPAVETLSIIAYRQPVTKSAIEATRGVSCDGMIQKLLNRDLIKIAGRSELPGRPLLYVTTPEFFEHFGLKSIEDLPNFDELRRHEIPKESGELEQTSESAQLEFEPS